MDVKGPHRLEAHECYDIDYNEGLAVFTEAVGLCYLCHAFIHCGRLESMKDLGKVPRKVFMQVMNHGGAILRKNGLKKSVEFTGDTVAPWASWRLKVGEETYPTRFKNFQEWADFYEHEPNGLTSLWNT